MTTPMSPLLLGLNGNGLIKELNPKTKKMLKMLEPMTLPTAISGFLLYAATADVASSGSDVPTATTVRPMSD